MLLLFYFFHNFDSLVGNEEGILHYALPVLVNQQADMFKVSPTINVSVEERGNMRCECIQRSWFFWPVLTK